MALDKPLPHPTADQGDAPLVGPVDDRAVRVLRQFRMVFSAVRRHFQSVEKQAGIGGAQVWALSLIAAHPGLGVNQLAAAMDIHQSTASNLVRSLTRQGLVQTAKARTDRRVTELFVQPEGQLLLNKVPGPHAGLLPQALTELDAATLTQLELHLGTLIKRMDVDDQSARTPLAMM